MAPIVLPWSLRSQTTGARSNARDVARINLAITLAAFPACRGARLGRAENWLARYSARSRLRRAALSSMVARLGRSGQIWRAQGVKTEENRAGSIRFISKVGQRPLGTPVFRRQIAAKKGRARFAPSGSCFVVVAYCATRRRQ